MAHTSELHSDEFSSLIKELKMRFNTVWRESSNTRLHLSVFAARDRETLIREHFSNDSGYVLVSAVAARSRL